MFMAYPSELRESDLIVKPGTDTTGAILTISRSYKEPFHIAEVNVEGAKEVWRLANVTPVCVESVATSEGMAALFSEGLDDQPTQPIWDVPTDDHVADIEPSADMFWTMA